jgi:hypothetical protein
MSLEKHSILKWTFEWLQNDPIFKSPLKELSKIFLELFILLCFIYIYRNFKWVLLFKKKKIGDSIVKVKDGAQGTHVSSVKFGPKWTLKCWESSTISYNYPTYICTWWDYLAIWCFIASWIDLCIVVNHPVGENI